MKYFARITIDELKIKIEKDYKIRTTESNLDTVLSTLTRQIIKDINIKFSNENCGYEKDGLRFEEEIIGYNTLRNGLTYLGCWSAGDWESPVFYIIYFNGKKLRAYVPKNGNTWNTLTREAYGNNAVKDIKNINERWPEYLEDYDDPDDFEASNAPDWDEKEIIKELEEKFQPIEKRLERLKVLSENLEEEIQKCPHCAYDGVDVKTHNFDAHAENQPINQTLPIELIQQFEQVTSNPFEYSWISERMLKPIIEYVEYGRTPGDFLCSLLKNDLFNAVRTADDQNIKLLKAYIGMFYNSLPSDCYGTREKFTRWVSLGGKNGIIKINAIKINKRVSHSDDTLDVI